MLDDKSAKVEGEINRTPLGKIINRACEGIESCIIGKRWSQGNWRACKIVLIGFAMINMGVLYRATGMGQGRGILVHNVVRSFSLPLVYVPNDTNAGEAHRSGGFAARSSRCYVRDDVDRANAVMLFVMTGGE